MISYILEFWNLILQPSTNNDPYALEINISSLFHVLTGQVIFKQYVSNTTWGNIGDILNENKILLLHKNAESF